MGAEFRRPAARRGGEQSAGNRRQHHWPNRTLHLHLGHHGLTQGRGHVESSLLDECGHVRNRRLKDQAGQSHLSVPTALSRHRFTAGGRLILDQRCGHVRAAQILRQRLSQRYSRQQLHPHGLHWRTLPIFDQYPRRNWGCLDTFAFHHGQRHASGHLDELQTALRH